MKPLGWFLIESAWCLYKKRKFGEKARVGCFKRTALKHVYYLGWNGSPAQVGCMRQVLGPGALGRPRGSGGGGRWEGGSGGGPHVNPWLFHFNVWQNPLQIKIKKKKKRKFGLAKEHQGHVNMKESPCEETARRQSDTSQGERSQEKPHILTLWSWSSYSKNC